MTVSAVVDIVHGELLNTPAINRIESIRIDARKIRRGDLYIPFFENDTESAIENGAYAVIVPRNIRPLDEETAWIAVEDINQALLLLLRYLLVEKEILFYHLPEPLFSLASAMLGRNKEVVLLEGSIANYVEALAEKEEIRFVLSSDLQTLTMLSSTVDTLTVSEAGNDSLGESLFVSKLYAFGERLQFGAASRLTRYVALLAGFCREHRLTYDSDLRSPKGVFDAYYLHAGNVIATKATSRVLVIDYPFSDSYIQESVRYLKEHFRWARTVLLTEKTECATREAVQSAIGEAGFDILYVVTRNPAALYASFSVENGSSRSANLFD